MTLMQKLKWDLEHEQKVFDSAQEGTALQADAWCNIKWLKQEIKKVGDSCND